MDVYEAFVGLASQVAFAKRHEPDAEIWKDALLFALPRLYQYQERFLNLDQGDVYFPSPSYWTARFFGQVDKGLRDCDESKSLESISLTPSQIGRESRAYAANERSSHDYMRCLEHFESRFPILKTSKVFTLEVDLVGEWSRGPPGSEHAG